MKWHTTAAIKAIALALLLMTAACTHPISRQRRYRAEKENITFDMVLANPNFYKGRTVLWGGRIIETVNFRDGAELIVLQTPLDFLGEPDEPHASQGRFIARSPRFLDPAVYKADRAVTLAGVLHGAEDRAVDQTTYTYPVVMVEELHLWEEYYYQPYPDYYRYDPFWGPYVYGPTFYYYGGDHRGRHDRHDNHDRKGGRD